MTDVHLHFAAVADDRPPIAGRRPPTGRTADGGRQTADGSAVGGRRSAVEHDLSADEIARARRFVFERDRAWYVAAHSFLRRTLASYLGCGPREIEFVAGAHGRPELASGKLRFNLSHTPGLVMVGVTESADIGVDVEHIQRPLDLDSIAPVVLTPRERAAWPGERAPFFRTWTLKESYVKARGVGLSLDLQSFGFDEGTPPRLRCEAGVDEARSWEFMTLAPTARHCAAAAVRATDVRWIVHR